MSYSTDLARLCMRSVDTEEKQKAALHLIDWIGCAAIGSISPVAKAIWEGSELPGAENGNAKASLNPSIDPWRSLLFEGAIGNVLEMDDIHREALVHPGPVIIPAALFIARRLQCSGADLLEAIVRGYEAMIRLGLAVGPSHYTYWHNTATCGPIGAAAAVSSLLKLPEFQWADAFGHAVTQSAGLWQVRLDPCMSKQWHIARAAQTGVQAALLARSGVTGPAHVLEGSKGFFAAMCPDGDHDLLLDEPHGPWKILSTSFKPWPACRHAHAAIDAALSVHQQLMQQHGPKNKLALLNLIAKVHIRTYGDALAFCDNPEPRTPSEGRFSLQHAVALTLLCGEPTLSGFELPALNEPTCCALRARTVLECSEPWASRYPQHFGAEITVMLHDGSILQAHVDDAYGDPERPLCDEAVLRKARTLMAAADYPAPLIDDWLAHCLQLIDAPSIALSALHYRRSRSSIQA